MDPEVGKRLTCRGQNLLPEPEPSTTLQDYQDLAQYSSPGTSNNVLTPTSTAQSLDGCFLLCDK